MREESLQCQVKRRWVRTTDSDHGYRVYPNRLKGLEVRETQSGMGGRYHVYSDRGGIFVFGGGVGFVFAQSDWLGVIGTDRL